MDGWNEPPKELLVAVEPYYIVQAKRDNLRYKHTERLIKNLKKKKRYANMLLKGKKYLKII